MTSARGDDVLTVNRRAATIQKALSAMLCLVATVSAAYSAVHGIWVMAAVFSVGFVLALQSYRVARETDSPLQSEVIAAESAD